MKISYSIRKKHKYSRELLSDAAGVHVNIIGKYERGETKPTIEVASKIADFLGVSLDYLVGKNKVELDKSITERVTTIQNLPNEDQQHILFALDAMIRDAKARTAYQ